MHDDEVTPMAERLLARIRTDLLETSPDFGIDSNLFEAGLDSMAIMQLMLLIEEDFQTELPSRVVTRSTFATAREIAQAILSEKRSCSAP